MLAGVTYISSGNSEFVLIKLNARGGAEWSRLYGGTSWDEAQDMVRTNDEGFALAGWTYSYGMGLSDMYLVKTDSSGNQE